jgi:Flp pilus assembly protein TadD
MKNLEITFIKKEIEKIHNFFNAKMYEKVIEKTKILIKKDPYQTPFYNYMALSYRQLNQATKAKDILIKGLELRPKSQSLLNNLASTYRILENFTEAEKILIEIININPKNASALCNYANLKRDLNQNKGAIELYEKAFLIDQNNFTILINLSSTYQIIGEFEKSKFYLKLLEKNSPHTTIQDKMFSAVHEYNDIDDHQNIMLEKISNKKIPEVEKINLYFGLAKSYSDQKNYEKSADFFIKGNFEKRKLFKNYNFEEENKLFNIISSNFKNLNSEVYLREKIEPNLIFVVGLPRSGTTLLHQIISSHSKVYGAGELPILRTALLKNIFETNFFRENILNEKKLILLRNEIIEKYRNYDNNHYILDKAPLNFQWIGFIKIMFPGAKIIHSSRNLKDNALSIYKNAFEGSAFPWSYDQDELLKFVNLYKKFMKFWHEIYPKEIYDCVYESLINNQVEETKKLIKFCNLDWEENCLNYTKNKSGIKTVSISQARKPLYKASIELYKKYLSKLKFLENIE